MIGRFAAIGIAGAIAASAACGTDSAAQMPSDCPADEPSSCPSPMPSYANDVAPLVAKYCEVVGCHIPGGTAADQVMSPYNQLFARHIDVLNQIYQCRMPLDPPAPTLSERVTLLGWFVCGAPNN